MTIAVHGIGVGQGVAIGRAVVVAAQHVDVGHYFIEPHQVEEEITRVEQARMAVMQDLQTLHDKMPSDAPGELAALLEVHVLLLQDEDMMAGVHDSIRQRLYNGGWALATQYERLARQFDEMDDPYLRERKADLEQVIQRVLQRMHSPDASLIQAPVRHHGDTPLVLVAHDLTPSDMLQFRQSVFAGFVTDVGGKTSHTAIVARSMGIPAIVGARTASHVVQQDDWVVIDGDYGVMLVNPPPMVLDEYRFKQQQDELNRSKLKRLLHTPAVTLDGKKIELMANIELPQDTEAVLALGAVGVGLFRSEFLFMGRKQHLPDEEEQYQAYSQAVQGMQGLPLTIRTIDVGADKPLGNAAETTHLNPALGLRAIRWSLSEPDMFLTQVRAILRASALGKINMLLPMVAHFSEIHQTLELVAKAKQQLDAKGQPYGKVNIGVMIEVPAAALMAQAFLKYFDFLSIGTNDLIQYTLAIDRADEQVAHLYDPTHPAVLQLLRHTIQAANAAGKPVCVCGEMAGDTTFTRLLLGMGLRSFSMHPAQILAVKQEIVRADVSKLEGWAQQVMQAEAPGGLLRGKAAG